MELVLRTIFTYIFILLLLRFSGGKRSLAQITTFDFVLLLIIGEATQQAILGQDFSVTNSALVIVTLVGLDIAFTLVKQRFRKLEEILEGVPLVILENGRPLKQHLHKSRLDETDILSAARKHHGLERLDQIKYAVLEKDGGLTIIPK